MIGKGYIADFTTPSGGIAECRFCEEVERAFHFDTRESAEKVAAEFSSGIRNPQDDGNLYTCHTFKVESLVDGKFVVRCAAPAKIVESGSASKSE